MTDFHIDPSVVENLAVGDIFTLHGKRYRLTKKTRTAVAVERYYWFHKILDKLATEGEF